MRCPIERHRRYLLGGSVVIEATEADLAQMKRFQAALPLSGTRRPFLAKELRYGHDTKR